MRPDGLDPVGALAPSGLLTSQALSPEQTPKKRLSLRVPLSRLSPLEPCDSVSTPPQGLGSLPARRLPLQGAGLLGLSAVVTRALFELKRTADYFFLSKDPGLLPPRLPSLCGPSKLSLR